jgi:predicted transcriptional regulator
MEHITLRISDSLYRRLRQRSEHWDVPIEYFIEFAAEDLLRREAKAEAEGQFGSIQ